MELTLPVVKVVVMPANKSALDDAEADLLALHVAAGLGRAGRRLDARLGQERRAGLFGHDDDAAGTGPTAHP